MTDIVERLRATHSVGSWATWCRGFAGPITTDDQRAEAAYEIERNRAAVAELVGALIEARGQVAEMCYVFKIPTPEASFERYDAAITKHQQPPSEQLTTKEQ